MLAVPEARAGRLRVAWTAGPLQVGGRGRRARADQSGVDVGEVLGLRVVDVDPAVLDLAVQAQVGERPDRAEADRRRAGVRPQLGRLPGLDPALLRAAPRPRPAAPAPGPRPGRSRASTAHADACPGSLRSYSMISARRRTLAALARRVPEWLAPVLPRTPDSSRFGQPGETGLSRPDRGANRCVRSASLAAKTLHLQTRLSRRGTHDNPTAFPARRGARPDRDGLRAVDAGHADQPRRAKPTEATKPAARREPGRRRRRRPLPARRGGRRVACRALRPRAPGRQRRPLPLRQRSRPPT